MIHRFLTLFVAAIWALTPAAQASPRVLAFEVTRDGAPIGTHRVSIDKSDDQTRVAIEIDFAVRFAFVTVYRYTHRSSEIWRDGRLVSLDAETDDNGTRTNVRARADAAGLRVSGSGGDYAAPLATVPTSYWNPEKVMRSPLLDTQSGKLIDVSAMTLESGPGGMRYRLRGDLEADLAYGPGGDWTGLSFVARGGRIDYIRRDEAASAVR